MSRPGSSAEQPNVNAQPGSQGDGSDLFEEFLSTSPDYAVIGASADGVIERWLGAAERNFGFTAEEAIGRSLALFFTEEDRKRGLDLHEIQVAKSQGRSEDDRWHVRRDGSRFWACGVLTAIRDASGNTLRLVKVVRDKTDVRIQIETLENEIQAKNEEAERGRRFMSETAHELRNPMMPIFSALSLLQRPDAAHLSGKALKILVNQMSVLRKLVDDLERAGDESVQPARIAVQPVDLNQAVQIAVDGVMEDAIGRRLQLSVVLPATEIKVAADPTRLQQMLLNLLNNALKYTPPHGHIGVSASIEANMGVVRIQDDGVGISTEMLPHIFQLFTRENRHPEVEGRGVGLAVVKQLARVQGGHVEARSAGRDKGSIFGLRLPLYLEQEEDGR